MARSPKSGDTMLRTMRYEAGQSLLTHSRRPGRDRKVEGGGRETRRPIRHGSCGLLHESAGAPVRVVGTVMAINNGPLQKKEELRVIVGFGRGNVLVISPFLVQVI